LKINAPDKNIRILVLTIGRINKVDTSSNGLLLRNLFGAYPKQNVAQIFSSGNNNDDGFFGKYYQLGVADRRLGRLFFRLKGSTQVDIAKSNNYNECPKPSSIGKWLRKLGVRNLMTTGLYELIFKPQISHEMKKWIEDFNPDIIFTQGYNLAFTILPLLISNNNNNIPIAYYPADDWPDYCYRPVSGQSNIISFIVRNQVKKLSYQLVKMASVHIAFNNPMKSEYLKRYGIEFSVLMQGDNYLRFKSKTDISSNDKLEYLIVSTGDFGLPRLPLLEDLNNACSLLRSQGIKITAKIYPTSNLERIKSQLLHCKFLQFEDCPTHEGLVSVLLKSDILFLPERFGENPERVRLSVSSKAHLFMFSGKPIVVYSHPSTGVLRYAKEEGWADIVETQNPKKLAQTIKLLITDNEKRKLLIESANKTANKNHLLTKIQDSFINLLQSKT
jgi:glycosyltransferase involved in cell wall biosynthesis